MHIKIETSDTGSGCTVWLGDNAVSFPSVEAAHAYIEQLQTRIEAAPPVFAAVAEGQSA